MGARAAVSFVLHGCDARMESAKWWLERMPARSARVIGDVVMMEQYSAWWNKP
jgi:hypothetical protein